mmetsp:Transcript_12113/g.13254  ORF Transcript_12113/g.13254 Transcript_12113/m.13254 type:complete len:90 (+) Transcript_12113:16-285(+)
MKVAEVLKFIHFEQTRQQEVSETILTKNKNLADFLRETTHEMQIIVTCTIIRKKKTKKNAGLFGNEQGHSLSSDLVKFACFFGLSPERF